VLFRSLEEYFIDASKLAWHVLDCLSDDPFFIVGGDVDDEAHNSKVKG
jgi:hypothetical protein